MIYNDIDRTLDEVDECGYDNYKDIYIELNRNKEYKIVSGDNSTIIKNRKLAKTFLIKLSKRNGE